jgi:hypothetical protein
MRIQVPALRELSMKALESLSDIPLPSGIKKVRPNPLTGSLLIEYDPGLINIMTYLKDMASQEELTCVLNKGGLYERH